MTVSILHISDLHRDPTQGIRNGPLVRSLLNDRRIELFANLYSRFYCGDRTYSLVPEEQYDIFSFPAEAIVIAAFNSCFNNDPLHRAGCIHPDAIAQAARRVEALRYQGYIPIAVWHHNTAGGPHSDDYMDSDTLQVLIDCGFSIGLHGHQHKPTFIDERFRFGTGRKITVISAGTLCGGYHALPHGHDRSYNLIELDTKTLNAKLHLRQMRNESFASPVWGEGRYSESNTGTIHFAIQEPPTPKVSVNSILSQAESLIARKEYVSARDILLAIATSDGMARRLLAECYTELPYDSLLIDNLFPPQSLNEAVLLADALWELGDRIRLGQLLRDQIIANSPDPTAIQLRQNYQGRVN